MKKFFLKHKKEIIGYSIMFVLMQLFVNLMIWLPTLDPNHDLDMPMSALCLLIFVLLFPTLQKKYYEMLAEEKKHKEFVDKTMKK